MRSVRFIKEPGYTYDLFFIFTLYFNKKYGLSRFINYKKSASDTRFFEKVMDEFKPVPEELLVFFYLNNNPQNFISKYYFDPFEDKFLDGTYCLSLVQSELLNYSQVIDNVLHYYFPNESEETLNRCKVSLTVANDLMKRSDYESCVKSALYSFLIDPVPVIQCLVHELMTKELLLSKQYEKNYNEALQENFNYSNVAARLKTCVQQSMDIDSFDDVFVTFCYNNKNYIEIIFYTNAVLILLGVDYIDTFEYLMDIKYSPKLHEFGLAISEENRVAILQLIHEKKEITIKELEQTLNMAGTNAYYHLSLMIRAGLLKTRNKGRTVLYSINHHYFGTLINAIKDYSEEKEETT